MFSKTILKACIAMLLFLLLFHSCSAIAPTNNNDKNRTNNALVLMGLASVNTGCQKTNLTAIPNSLSYVTNVSRVQYTISSCTNESLLANGFTSDSLATFQSGGTSSTSKLVSTGDMKHSSGYTNVEVTFSLTSTDGYLDVYHYSSDGTTAPGFRITYNDVSFIKSDGTLFAGSRGTGLGPKTTSAVTYCLDFQAGKTGGTNSGTMMLGGWVNTPCENVPENLKNSMSSIPIMAMPPMMGNPGVPNPTGSKMGFVLNKASIVRFVVGSLISQVDW